MGLGKRTTYLLFILLLLTEALSAQEFPRVRARELMYAGDTVLLDSLSLVPHSLLLYDRQGKAVSDTLYEVDHVKALLWLKQWPNDSTAHFFLRYRVFPLSFAQTYYHKDASFLRENVDGRTNPFTYRASGGQDVDIFSLGGLNKSGNIARGISFGNNQDVVVNSALNLQLSGQIADDVEMLAAITDNNIPIQPEGNTQQIQEFDKVFIQLSNRNNTLVAGDYELVGRESYFLKYNKKAQGLSLKNRSFLNIKDQEQEQLTTRVSAAVSKGKYARNIIQGIEGNQGPYPLKGAENERFIIVLAGSEKVFLDGQLLKRGQNNDYVIDYNMAEISFTPVQIITKDSRIVVEFEYSDKTYTRSLLQAGTSYEKGDRLKIHLEYLVEQDAKNQPLLQEMDDEKKQFLSDIGDELDRAIFPNVDSLGFNPDEVRYQLKDSLVDGVLYDSVFAYSFDPDVAVYRLGFSLVGEGNGNYRQSSSTVNGRIYEWVAPVNGRSQGNYEPVVLLVTPKKKDMLVAGIEYQLSDNLLSHLELAMSRQDQNLFSDLDDKDNEGFGLKWGLDYKKQVREDSLKPLFLEAHLLSELTDKRFQPMERYRDAEFERNWNVGQKDMAVMENMNALSFSLHDGKQRELTYALSNYLQGDIYQGVQNGLKLNYLLRGFRLNIDGAYVDTREELNESGFLRHKASLSKLTGNWEIGLREETEKNKFRLRKEDSLVAPSHFFNSAELFLKSVDSNTINYLAAYKKRWDYMPTKSSFVLTSFANDVTAGLEKKNNPNTSFALKAIYRELFVADTAREQAKPDQSVISRLEFRKRMLKGAIVSGTFYEIGSGMEQKKEYSYIEVAAGQGTYTWKDYNGNGIKELNEFEVALYQDEATFIRVFTPTNDYIKAYHQMFNQVLNITPRLASKRKTRAGRWLSRFSTQTTYRIDRKTTHDVLLEVANPFAASVKDTALTSLRSSLRNTLFFNRNSSRFGIDFTFLDNRNKFLLTNGFESRSSLLKELRFRINLSSSFMLRIELAEGIKENSMEFFKERDYKIYHYALKPWLEYQSGTRFRAGLRYAYLDKLNLLGQREKAEVHNLGMETKYNIPKKGSLQAKLNYIKIQYGGEANTSLAYEMLEGLQVGKNFTWGLSYQRTVAKNMQMNIAYEARKPEEVKTIHMGSVQFRAFF